MRTTDVSTIRNLLPKLCSDCGSLNNDLTLSDREWRCPKCGTDHDRDINAAQNLRIEGRSILAAGSTESINAYGVRVRLAPPAVNSEVGIPHYSRTAAEWGRIQSLENQLQGELHYARVASESRDASDSTAR